MFGQWFRKHSSGFTMIEVLFSLSITLLIVLNCALLVKITKNNSLPNGFNSSIDNGIATLSYELYTAHDFSCGKTLDFYNSENEKCQVYLENQRLIISPGQNIICHGLDDVQFNNDNGLIYIICQHEQETRKYLIASEYETAQ